MFNTARRRKLSVKVFVAYSIVVSLYFVVSIRQRASLIADTLVPQSPLSDKRLSVSSSEESDVRPPWMKEYFYFHQQLRALLNETNWQEQRYFVARCLDTDDVCGGASDRLHSIPALLLIASTTKRLLLIKWSRPAALEEFLVPPDGGLDWRWSRLDRSGVAQRKAQLQGITPCGSKQGRRCKGCQLDCDTYHLH
jgi:hypothetical protein